MGDAAYWRALANRARAKTAEDELAQCLEDRAVLDQAVTDLCEERDRYAEDLDNCKTAHERKDRDMAELREQLTALEEADRQWDKTSLVEIVEERNELREELATAQARFEALHQHLKRHGYGHGAGCKAHFAQRCDCGWDDLFPTGNRAALDAALEAFVVDYINFRAAVWERRGGLDYSKWAGRGQEFTTAEVRLCNAENAALEQARHEVEARLLQGGCAAGHPAACLVHADEGTSYCPWCESLAQAREEGYRVGFEDGIADALGEKASEHYRDALKAEGAAAERERCKPFYDELRQCLNHIRMGNNNLANVLQQQDTTDATVTELVNSIERNVMRAVKAIRVEEGDDG